MSDISLIAFGCGVSFITLAGVYVYVREGFLASERRRKAEAVEASESGESAEQTSPGRAVTTTA